MFNCLFLSFERIELKCLMLSFSYRSKIAAKTVIELWTIGMDRVNIDVHNFNWSSRSTTNPYLVVPNLLSPTYDISFGNHYGTILPNRDLRKHGILLRLLMSIKAYRMSLCLQTKTSTCLLLEWFDMLSYFCFGNSMYNVYTCYPI